MALGYHAAGKLDRAKAWRRKWLAVDKERSQADSLSHAGELAGLGGNLLRQKRWTGSEPFGSKGYAGMKARAMTIPPYAAIRITEAFDRLIER